MDYIKIRFGDEFEHCKLKSEKSIEEMFQSLNPMFRLEKSSWKPQVDIYETDEDIVIHVTMAGVDKENMEIEISNKAIKITGKRSGNHPREKATYRLAEIQYGSFERILFLPCPIDTNKVTASYTNGFLQINLAKLAFE
ncbi:MAG: Hsp20/alpha crystallin family protein [Proteobacteria bacterium]|nr:Hsp20/alpha crystallin family protein [Pseudomonadota bacterium]